MIMGLILGIIGVILVGMVGVVIVEIAMILGASLFGGLLAYGV